MITAAPPPRPIWDPRAVPVTGVDVHLPALAATQLAVPALRAHFATVPLRAAERKGDGGLLPGVPLRRAAVLVPLRPTPAGVQVVLTQRTEHLRHHAGQISFPGGRWDDADADAWAVAGREAWEEIGLAPDALEPLGQLPLYTTVTGFQVTPCVAFIPADFQARLQADEVAEAFDVPLDFLMNPAHHRRHRVPAEAGGREFLSMPWQDGGRERFIWGATAAMLRNLYHQLRAGADA